MKRCLLAVLIIGMLLPDRTVGQAYSYSHYDITDGLAGSMAYCITQDADGFIWVGTETGVSRFDGTHFRNFTTADGLSDIEVLQIFGDSKGRVWMAPFRKSVCYYYRGKIYNPGNDPMLRKITLNGNVEGFAENVRGDVLIQEPTGLHVIGTDNDVRNLDSINGSPIRGCHAVCRSSSGNFLIQMGERMWEYAGDRFSILRHIDFQDDNPTYVAIRADGAIWGTRLLEKFESFKYGKFKHWPIDTVHLRHICYSLPDDEFVYFNTTDGSLQYDPRTGERRQFLPGSRVSRVFRDRDSSLWFATLDRGIYRLNSGEFRSMTFFASGRRETGVTRIFRYGHSLYVGNDYNRVFELSDIDYKVLAHPEWLVESKENVVFIDTLDQSRLIIATNVGICRTTLDIAKWDYRQVKIKCMCKTAPGELAIGSAYGLTTYSIGDCRVLDTLSHERSTAVYYTDGTIFFGTMTGLYRVGRKGPVTFMGNRIPFLQKRISSITASADHTLWVASYDDAGVIGVRNDTVVAVITKKQGLTSDICRTLMVKDNTLWVGTDKGLNAVSLDRPGHPVTRYTADDGLGSNMINTLYADDSMIYVGTSVGLSFFNTNRPVTVDPCRLRLLNVSNSGTDRTADTGKLVLSYRSKDLHLEYAGISYRSAGNIRYRYRVLGLDTIWRETNATFLDYQSLPSAEYTFELQAYNKFGDPSNMVVLPFTIETPYWQSTWFRVLLIAAVLVLAWQLVSWRIRYIRRRQNEREELVRQRAEMENKALAAQMNPHFIFNCLNSIQQFMFDQDMMQTNEYVSGFARLIRATLNHSSKAFISLEEEVQYLSDYLALEKMRFKEKMEYKIEVDPGVDLYNTVLPPMLIQPYVENAMRHGLRNKKSGDGFIHVNIRKEGSDLVIEVEDNGIGRKRAMEYKTREHIEYQSKGMSMTASRMKLIGAVFGSHIRVEMQDRVAGGEAVGTKVIIVVPEFSPEA